MAERLIEEPSAMANKIRGRLLAKSHDDPKSTKSDEDDDDTEIPLFPGETNFLTGTLVCHLLPTS